MSALAWSIEVSGDGAFEVGFLPRLMAFKIPLTLDEHLHRQRHGTIAGKARIEAGHNQFALALRTHLLVHEARQCLGGPRFVVHRVWTDRWRDKSTTRHRQRHA